MSSFVRIAVCISLISMSCISQAMICSIGREPDPAYGNKLRWVIPVPDPCQCTDIRMGGTNARPPCRSFTATYHDTPIISNDYEEIRNWLGCPDINECDEQTHTCNPSHYEECFNTPGSYDCVCQQGYQRSQSDVPCKACHFSTVPHPTPYSYMFILEPQISPFTLNFSVKANGAAIVGLSENRDDTSVVIEILFGYYPAKGRIVVRACMPHLCTTAGDGSLYAEYTDTSPVTASTEYRPFWIHYDEGLVTAGKGGQQDNLVKWNAGDHHGRVPSELHIGISTWENNHGEWDFCQRDKHGQTESL